MSKIVRFRCKMHNVDLVGEPGWWQSDRGWIADVGELACPVLCREGEDSCLEKEDSWEAIVDLGDTVNSVKVDLFDL